MGGFAPSGIYSGFLHPVMFNVAGHISSTALNVWYIWPVIYIVLGRYTNSINHEK